MTVVISDGHYMAADSLITDDTMVHETQKIFTSPSAIIGIAGTLDHALKFVYWYNDSSYPKPKGNEWDFDALIWTKDQKLCHIQGDSVPVPIPGNWAIGSGASTAMGALYQLQELKVYRNYIGSELVEASVRTANALCAGCGGTIHSVKLHKDNLKWNFQIPARGRDKCSQ